MYFPSEGNLLKLNLYYLISLGIYKEFILMKILKLQQKVLSHIQEQQKNLLKIIFNKNFQMDNFLILFQLSAINILNLY